MVNTTAIYSSSVTSDGTLNYGSSARIENTTTMFSGDLVAINSTMSHIQCTSVIDTTSTKRATCGFVVANDTTI